MANLQPENRHTRHLVLPDFGQPAVVKLKQSHVFVLGCGGLGSPVVSYLAASGVGHLTLCDFDVVSLSNLQRQIIHSTPDLGENKAVSAARRALALNPEINVTTICEPLTTENAAQLLTNCQVAVDATDNFVSRSALADTCQKLGIYEVYGAVLGWSGQVTVLEPGRTLDSIFGDFPTQAPTGAQAGILSPLPGVIGAVMAAETLKICTQSGHTLAGKLQTYDARTGDWKTFNLPPISAKPDSPQGVA